MKASFQLGAEKMKDKVGCIVNNYSPQIRADMF